MLLGDVEVKVGVSRGGERITASSSHTAVNKKNDASTPWSQSGLMFSFKPEKLAETLSWKKLRGVEDSVLQEVGKAWSEENRQLNILVWALYH